MKNVISVFYIVLLPSMYPYVVSFLSPHMIQNGSYHLHVSLLPGYLQEAKGLYICMSYLKDNSTQNLSVTRHLIRVSSVPPALVTLAAEDRNTRRDATVGFSRMMASCPSNEPSSRSVVVCLFLETMDRLLVEVEEGGAKARVRVMAEKRLQSVTVINDA